MLTHRFDFMRWRHLSGICSAVLVALAIFGLLFRGLDLGIEFTGGALFDVHFPAPASVEQVRSALQTGGITAAQVQGAGSEQDVVIRLPTAADSDVGALSARIAALLEALQPGARVVSSEVIGPALGEELRDSAGLAALAAFGAVGVYILFRFTGKFAVGATAALIHDVIVTLGVLGALRLTFDMPAFAAILAIVGYSLNDTIVVYDRIRENLREQRTAELTDVINRALNQTLGRTLAMSATTLLTVLSLLLLGGKALRSFSAALAIGVVVGTYSSIYIASSLLVALRLDRTSLLRPPPEDESGHP